MVPDNDNLCIGALALKIAPDPGTVVAGTTIDCLKDGSGMVPVAVLIAACHEFTVVVDAGTKVILPQTSQSPAVKLIDVRLVAVVVEIDVEDAKATVLDTYSPTSPAVTLSLVVVPTIPPVVGLKVMLVAIAAPSVGVVKVGLVDPTKLPIPDCPERETPTELMVVILHSPYMYVNPCVCPPPMADQIVFATIHIKFKESYWFVDARLPGRPKVVLLGLT